jgi:hypothetical protein
VNLFEEDGCRTSRRNYTPPKSNQKFSADYSLAPRTQITDLTHEIPAGDIRAGAFALLASYAYFPRHTIHVAVVDPGVGSTRRAIAVKTADYFFVGPDNGLLSWALAREKIKTVQTLENRDYFLPEVSSTFHGRDVFAPVAAHLSRGVPIHKLGAAVTDFVKLEWFEPKLLPGDIRGVIIYIDRFGNAISNIGIGALKGLKGEPAVFLKGKRVCALARFYSAVPCGKAVALAGSNGFLEIAVNRGNAAKVLGLKVGSELRVKCG